ncbi:MAG: UbiA family prenyltransferase [Candidatus Anstonellales archaeon]
MLLVDFYTLFPFVFIPFFITLYSFAINDILDYKTDIKNKRSDRPLANNLLSISEAKFIVRLIWVLLLLLFLVAAYYSKDNLNLFVALIVLWIFYVFSLLYSVYLKDMYVVGNIFIAFSMAIPFAYAGILSLNVTTTQKLLFVIAFLMGLARELIKSIQDIEGDVAERNSRTLPVLIGKVNSFRLAFWFIATSLLIALINLFLSFIVLLEPINSINILMSIVLVITIGYAYLYALSINSDDNLHLEKFRNLTKKLMVINILFYFVSIIIGVTIN